MLRLAKLRLLYFYWDVICCSRYTRHIRDMHRNYGPIVRIKPNEVHCNDIDFSDEIYATRGRKRGKPTHQVDDLVIIHWATPWTKPTSTTSRLSPRRRTGSVCQNCPHPPSSTPTRRETETRSELVPERMMFLGPTDQRTCICRATIFCNERMVLQTFRSRSSLGFLAQEDWYPNFRDPTNAAIKPVYLFLFSKSLKHFDNSAAWVAYYLPEDVGPLVRTLQIDVPNWLRDNGMSTVITHHDENVFPDSHAFIPELWLDESNQRRKEVERGPFTFSRGTRQCVAMK
ncbi:hypothetical protein PG994_010187 [Apiospora phragmitis]|uniref:Uncharacterized protein n=1 Tax=Apiospora phragmitis TaxID=2905665 RepID=A0ABR1TPR5_9PEZI